MTLKITCITLLIYACAVSSHPSTQYDTTKYEEPKKPYSFSYGVKDDYRGTDFERNEKSDGNVVTGSYSVQLPDGRKQTVKYEADHQTGFVADVSYYGVAKYPPPSKEPPFVVRSDGYKSSHETHLIPKPVIDYHRPHFSPKPLHDGEEHLHSIESPHVHIKPTPQEHPLHLPQVYHQETIQPTPITKPQLTLHELDVPENIHHPEVPSPQKHIFDHEVISIHQSGSPHNNHYEHIPSKPSNEFTIIPQNNYEIHEIHEEPTFLNENEIITKHKTPFEPIRDSGYHEIQLFYPGVQSHKLDDSNDDLFIPNYAYSLEDSRPFHPLKLQESDLASQELLQQTPIYGSSHESILPEQVSGFKDPIHSNEPEEHFQDFDFPIVDPLDFLTDDPHKVSGQGFRNPVDHPPIYIPNITEKPVLRTKPLYQPKKIYAKQETPSEYVESISLSHEETKHQAPSILLTS